MISTVTTSTITTVTTIAAMGFATAISVAAAITLIAFLSTKQLAGASSSRSSQLIARFLNVGILPLIMAFAVIVAVKIAEVLA